MKQQLTVAEAGSTALLGQYETAVGEKEGLMTNCKMVEGQLDQAWVRGEEMETQLREKEGELKCLREQLSRLGEEMVERGRERERKLEEREGLMTNCKMVEGQLDQARAREEEMETQLREKGGELECLREQLSGLGEEMAERGREMERKLEEREGEMAELRETSANQIRALEVCVYVCVVHTYMYVALYQSCNTIPFHRRDVRLWRKRENRERRRSISSRESLLMRESRCRRIWRDCRNSWP